MKYTFVFIALIFCSLQIHSINPFSLIGKTVVFSPSSEGKQYANIYNSTTIKGKKFDYSHRLNRYVSKPIFTAYGVPVKVLDVKTIEDNDGISKSIYFVCEKNDSLFTLLFSLYAKARLYPTGEDYMNDNQVYASTHVIKEWTIKEGYYLQAKIYVYDKNEFDFEVHEIEKMESIKQLYSNLNNYLLVSNSYVDEFKQLYWRNHVAFQHALKFDRFEFIYKKKRERREYVPATMCAVFVNVNGADFYVPLNKIGKEVDILNEERYISICKEINDYPEISKYIQQFKDKTIHIDNLSIHLPYSDSNPANAELFIMKDVKLNPTRDGQLMKYYVELLHTDQTPFISLPFTNELAMDTELAETYSNRLAEIKAQEEAEQKAEQIAEKAHYTKLVKKYGVKTAKEIKDGTIRIGWSKEMCLESWGKPERINRTITKYGTNEQWVYSENTYLYFSKGKLIAIQD